MIRLVVKVLYMQKFVSNLAALVKLGKMQRAGKLADAIDVANRIENIGVNLDSLEESLQIARVRFAGITNNAVQNTLNIKTDDDDILHASFQDVYRVIAAGCNPFLVGPAGGGKSTILAQVANAMGINLYAMSVNAMTSDYNIIGYRDANGRYVSTGFRDAYENGGLFSFEEIDAGNPNVLTVINNAIGQPEYMFPDKTVRRHPRFILAASGNTYGTGANMQYVGRNPLDAATLDRFETIFVDYDDAMEERLCGDKKWLEFIRRTRNIINSQQMKVIVSTRAVIDGVRLLNAGMSYDKVAQMRVFKGMAKSDIDKILSNAKTW